MEKIDIDDQKEMQRKMNERTIATEHEKEQNNRISKEQQENRELRYLLIEKQRQEIEKKRFKDKLRRELSTLFYVSPNRIRREYNRRKHLLTPDDREALKSYFYCTKRIYIM